MAKEKADKETQGERIFNIPLRREWIKVPKNKRGKRASHALRGFVSKHTKSYDVKISQKINEKIWIRGIQKPPQSIRVKISRDSDGVIHIRLPEEIVKKPKEVEKKGLGRLKETLEKEKGLPLGLGGGKEEILRKGKKKEERREKPAEKPKEEKPKKEKK